MHVSRLTAFIAVEEEAIWAYVRELRQPFDFRTNRLGGTPPPVRCATARHRNAGDDGGVSAPGPGAGRVSFSVTLGSRCPDAARMPGMESRAFYRFLVRSATLP